MARLIALLSLVLVVYAHPIRKVWSMPFPQVAVVEAGVGGGRSPFLTVTTFNPAPHGGSTVGILPFGTNLSTPPQLTVLNSSFNWPNQASPVELLGKRVILAAGGFLVPTHDTGEVVLIDPSTGLVTPVARPKPEYFYHKAILQDMNGDGLVDILAARAKVPSVRFWESRHTELVWFEAPSWEEHVLVEDGPGVAFEWTSAFSGAGPNNTLPVLVAAQFFIQPRLAIYYCSAAGAKAWSECPKEELRNLTIDATEGSFFGARVADLNGDGSPEILATNNRADGRGGVFVYEPPAGDWRIGAWTKHVLSRGWRPKSSWLPKPGQGAPGTCFPVWLPSARGAAPSKPTLLGNKPTIVFSTDDGGQVVQLVPRSNASDDWQYDNMTITTSPEGTIGSPTALDVDGDGWPELFVPNYNQGTLDMWSWGA